MAEREFDLKEEQMLQKIGSRYKDKVTVNKKYTKGNQTITEHAVSVERPKYKSKTGGAVYVGQDKFRVYEKTVTTRDSSGNVTGFEKLKTVD